MEAESERRKNWYKLQFEGKKPAEQKAVYSFWRMKLTHDRGNCPQAITELDTAYQEAAHHFTGLKTP